MNIFCVGNPPCCELGQWISTLIVSFCFFSSGMAMGWTSPAFSKVKKEEVPQLTLSSVQMSLLAALPFFSRLLSPIPSSYLMDWAGRRGSLTAGRVLQLIHWGLMYSSYNIWVLYTARFLSGWFSGMGAFITGVYVGETTHKKIRGRTQAFLNVNFYLGAFFSAGIGSLVSYDNLIIISGVVDFFTFLFMFLIPETPYFHLKLGDYTKAEHSLRWLRGYQDVQKELNRIDRYIQRQMLQRNAYSYIFAEKASRKAFVIVQVLLVLQRCSGVVAIISYASFITPDTWWLSDDTGPVALNLTYPLACFISSLFVDTWGRKTLLIFSSSGCSLFLCGCAIWFGLDHSNYMDVSGTKWIPIFFLLAQAAFYSLGMCYIPALIMSEMFPMNIKAKASALGAMSATLVSMMIVFIFLPLTNSCGMYCNFMIYTLATFLSAIYSATIIETKGKTLETIQANLEGRIASDSSISTRAVRPSDEADDL